MDPHGELRDATRSRHERLDKGLGIASPDARYPEYLAYIAALCGWLQPLETRLAAREWPCALQVARRCNKSAWIHDDLLAAREPGLPAPAVRLCVRLPQAQTPAAYDLGILYVIEGSQLGGRYLARQLQRAHPGRQFRYLQGYGDELGKLWKGYMAFIADALQSAQDRAWAVDGACAAFDTLTDWLQQQGQFNERPSGS